MEEFGSAIFLLKVFDDVAAESTRAPVICFFKFTFF